MAQYNRYVFVPHRTYDEFRNATLGNGYNVDYNSYNFGFNNQCWDYCALLYHQYGLTLYTKAGGGVACDCWNISRQANSQYPFQAVYGIQNIRRGDIVVTNANAWSKTGHIFIADENYRTSGDTLKIWGVGQNQRGNSLLPVTRDEIGLRYFLGIFRNTEWVNTPPVPPPTPPEPEPIVYNRSGYNFVLFNRRKRQEKWTKRALKRN